MKRTLLAAASALLLAVPGARAATFDLSLVGSGTHWYVNGVPGCDFSNSSDPCTVGYATETWIGQVAIQTDSSADGTYVYGAGLESIGYTSNFDWFSYVRGDAQHLVYPQFGGSEPYLAGMVPGASVTIAGGHVAGISGSFAWDGTGSVDFSGLSLADYHGGQAGQPNADWWNLSGVLADGSTPTTSPAPEPATWLLFALGLGALTIKRIEPSAGTRWPRSSSR